MTYDSQSNLFLAGTNGTEIAELPSGSSAFTTIQLSEDLGDAGTLQWDGKYITLQGLRPPVRISRISVAGSTGTVVSQSRFSPYMKRASYSYIAGDGTVAFPFGTQGDYARTIGIWRYPKGGHTIRKLKEKGAFYGFGDVVVSVAPSSAARWR